jgi:hypothetical protein
MYPVPAVAVEVVPSAGNAVVLIVEEPMVTPVTVPVKMLAAEALLDAIVGDE